MEVFPCVQRADWFSSDENDPDDGKDAEQRKIEVIRAKWLCSKCGFRIKCLQVAVSDPSRRGIYGGSTTAERLCMRGVCRHAEHRKLVA